MNQKEFEQRLSQIIFPPFTLCFESNDLTRIMETQKLLAEAVASVLPIVDRSVFQTSDHPRGCVCQSCVQGHLKAESKGHVDGCMCPYCNKGN